MKELYSYVWNYEELLGLFQRNILKENLDI